MVKGQQVTLEIPGQLIYHSEINRLYEVKASSAQLQSAFGQRTTIRSKVGFSANFFAPTDIHWLFGFVVHFAQPVPDTHLTGVDHVHKNVVYTSNWPRSMRTVSLMTANQEFSRLIKEVEHGEGFLITRRGRPIAKLVPHMADKTADPEWAAAYRRMMARLEEGAALGGLRVDREELYDR